MAVKNSNIAMVISSVKREIYPLDLNGIEMLTVSLRKWKKNNLGCHLLKKNGEVLDIVDARLQERSWVNSVATAASLSTAKLDVSLAVSKLSFDVLKDVVCEGVVDYASYFGSDEDMEWSILKKPIDKLVSEIRSSNSTSELVKVLDYSSVNEPMPHL